MREDQAKRLEDMEERLIEAAIADADPQNWAGAGELLMDMNRNTRGDAAWCRKTAIQTVALAMNVRKLIADYRAPQLPDPKHPHDDDPEEAIAAAEAQAQALIERVTGGSKSRR